MHISKKNILLFSFILFIVTSILLFKSLNLSQRITKAAYDNRCQEEVKYIVTDKNKLIRLNNPYSLSHSKLEEFSQRYYFFEYFLDYVRRLEYGSNSPIIDQYFTALQNHSRISDVILTKKLYHLSKKNF